MTVKVIFYPPAAPFEPSRVSEFLNFGFVILPSARAHMVEDIYNRGLVVGKFMPLHAGHVYLLESAMARCHRLTILVFSRSDDPIPGKLRVGWVKKMFPEADVVHHCKTLPKDRDGTAFWDIWLKSLVEHCHGQKFNVVFSSEAYGKRLATDLGADHVLIDPNRTRYSVSATDIRNSPYEYWGHIPEIVKPYFSDQSG